MKSAISVMSSKKTIVHDGKDGKCPTLDSTFEKIHDAYKKSPLKNVWKHHTHLV